MCGQSYKHMLYYWFIIMDWLFDCIYNAQIDFWKLYIEHGNYEEYTYFKAAACIS